VCAQEGYLRPLPLSSLRFACPMPCGAGMSLPRALWRRSNFAFVWPWDAWAAVARQPEWSPQRMFAAEVLEKELRLAYFQKVKEASTPLAPGPRSPTPLSSSGSFTC